jgi:hypothetical protein
MTRQDGRNLVKRRALTLLIAGALTQSSASTAFAAQPTTPRQDDYVQSFCTIEGVGDFPAERYDVNAVDGHGTAVSHFNLHHPGIVCQVGP